VRGAPGQPASLPQISTRLPASAGFGDGSSSHPCPGLARRAALVHPLQGPVHSRSAASRRPRAASGAPARRDTRRRPRRDRREGSPGAAAAPGGAAIRTDACPPEGQGASERRARRATLRPRSVVPSIAVTLANVGSRTHRAAGAPSVTTSSTTTGTRSRSEAAEGSTTSA
jgi:hypothetical protein